MRTLAPGLSLHHIGGHTKGLQAVRVWTRVGWLVLASDASHYYANMGEGRPFPVVASVTEMADGWRKLHTLVDDPGTSSRATIRWSCSAIARPAPRSKASP